VNLGLNLTLLVVVSDRQRGVVVGGKMGNVVAITGLPCVWVTMILLCGCF